MQPLRDAATPLNDLYSPSSYLALQSVDVPGGRRTWETSAFLERLPNETLDALVADAAAASLEASRIGILPLGGAVARTAFRNRLRRSRRRVAHLGGRHVGRRFR